MAGAGDGHNNRGRPGARLRLVGPGLFQQRYDRRHRLERLAVGVLRAQAVTPMIGRLGQRNRAHPPARAYVLLLGNFGTFYVIPQQLDRTMGIAPAHPLGRT